MRLRPGTFGLAGLVCIAVSPRAFAATTSVEMKDNVFIPASVSIAPGDTVTWTNNGRSPHNVTWGDQSKK